MHTNSSPPGIVARHLLPDHSHGAPLTGAAQDNTHGSFIFRRYSDGLLGAKTVSVGTWRSVETGKKLPGEEKQARIRVVGVLE